MSAASSPSGSLNIQMAQQLAKYDQKINELLSSQLHRITIQIEKLKVVLKKNQQQLSSQKKSIQQLSQKIAIIQVRTESKVALLSKELQNFKKYYDQCYKYTVARVNDIFERTNLFSTQIQRQLQILKTPLAVQYIKYANGLIVSIMKGFYLRSQELTYSFHSDLFEFEIQLGKLVEFTERFHLIQDELKIMRYGNESLKESLQKSIQFLADVNQRSIRDSQVGKKIANYFQPKFKQILKKIHGYSIQIQMVKLMAAGETKTANEAQRQKIIELENKLGQLGFMLEGQKNERAKQVLKKQEIIGQKNKIISQLQQSLIFAQKKQVQMECEIQRLQSNNEDCCKKIQSLNLKIQIMNSELTQVKLGQNRRRALSKQKIRQYEQKLLQMNLQHQKLLQKCRSQQANLEQLMQEIKKRESDKDKQRWDKFGIEEETAQSQLSIESNKILKRSPSKAKKGQVEDSKSWLKTNMLQSQCWMNILNDNQRLGRQNKQLTKINKSLQQQIHNFILAKADQHKEDEEYQVELESQLERSSIQNQQLAQINFDLTQKNHQLLTQNEKLLDQLENFELASQHYKNTVYQLQQNIEILTVKNQELRLDLAECVQNLKRAGKKELSIGHPPRSQGQRSNLNNSGKETKSQNEGETMSRKSSNFLQQLQGAITNSKLPIPIFCEIDENGYIIEHKTGSYLVDKNKKPIQVSEAELDAALEAGLLLI